MSLLTEVKMPVITFQDLQYRRERELHSRIKPAFDHLRTESRVIKERVNLLEQTFYRNLGQSIRMDSHPRVRGLLDDVQRSLCTDFEIQVFLSNNPMPNACVMPRYGQNGDPSHRASRAVIMVSGHFFNELDEAEQKAILGHEIGHIMFGHIDVPRELVSHENEQDDPELSQFLADLMRWSICCEVSCDMAGLVASGGDAAAAGTALLKFSSGLSRDAVAVLGSESLIENLRNQYDEIADSAHADELSSHPLVPLRLRVLESAAKSDLVTFFGSELDPTGWERVCTDYQAEIDSLVGGIYPELIGFSGNVDLQKISLNLGMAVGLSDGELIPEEFSAILELSGIGSESQESLALTVRGCRGSAAKKLARKCLDAALHDAHALGLRRRDVLSILRSALIVAAMDGHIDLEELRVIAEFAEPYQIEKEEILYMANQVSGAA